MLNFMQEEFVSNLIVDKSFDFAVRTVKLCRFLQETHHEYVLSKQLLTSIIKTSKEKQNAH
jgi:hypothetical protein